MSPPELLRQISEAGWQGAQDELALISALIATDIRPTALFSGAGEVLLTNAAADATLSDWRSFGRSAAWAGGRDEALARGSCRISHAVAVPVDLFPIAMGGGARVCYLMRLDGIQGTAAVQSFTEMAHDLRAPLQSLIIAAEGLADSNAADRRAIELGALAQLAVDHIGDLLDTVRGEATEAGAEPQSDFDLIAVVRDSVRLLEPICARSGNHILQVLPQGTAWHSGHPRLLRVILQNLITNANRFNVDGPITVRLQFSSVDGRPESLVTLEVEDVGPGLTLAEQRLVLGPVGHGPGLAPVSKGGYGLGLGIVSRAVSRLRGQISVGSGKERGALFRIVFPLPVACPPASEMAKAIDAADIAGLKILLVEDNPVNRAILSGTLTEAGAVVEGVANGLDALRRIKSDRGRPDVVLLDLNLPDIDGTEVARRIRSIGGDSFRPLIIGLTAHVGAEVHRSCLAAGMDQVLTKPLRPSRLRKVLADATAGRRVVRSPSDPMQVPDVLLNDAIIQELATEMGRPATLAFMQRALEEARDVFDSARNTPCAGDLRARIHSAIGSSGLTGLSGIEYALRQLQEGARSGICDPASLDLAAEVARNTALRLHQYAGEG